MESALCRPQSLILSPTRELAGQTTKTIQAMGEFMKVRAHTCVGGTNLGEPASLRPPCSPLSLLVLSLLSVDRATDLFLRQSITDIMRLCSKLQRVRQSERFCSGCDLVGGTS